jgi:hypothetical protein
MDKELLKKVLMESALSEAKPVGLAITDKVKAKDKKENDDYYKEVAKKMEDYEKASTSSTEDAIEEPKFNYDYENEVEYHEDMEIRNGMEMLNYDRKPSEKFSQRAKEAIEGSNNMGNNPEWANVVPKQQGFTGPEFGKDLVSKIERSKKKRDAASELSNKNTTSVNATDFKDSSMTNKKPKSIAISEDNTNNKSVIKEFNWPKSTLSSTFSQILYNELKKTFTNRYFIVIGKDLYLSQPHGDKKLLTINSDTDSVESIIGKLNKLLTYNKSEIKETTKMKRLKFKKAFNGIETALNVIPESYKVDNKVFEMTDGNEHYKIRWEGSLNEGTAIVLNAYDDNLVKEDFDKIKHLMNFKSQDTLGNLKGSQRLDENQAFADMIKKTRTIITEGEGAEHLQELSPETYDSVRDAGLERGDRKGAALVDTANELKYRPVIGTEVKYLPTDGLGREGKVAKIKEYDNPNFVDVVIWDGYKMEEIKIFKDNNDVKVQGLRTEVDRPTANMLAKVKELAFGVESKANDFKQLAETDKPDFLDLDKDGNTEEAMKDAAKDAAKDDYAHIEALEKDAHDDKESEDK